MECDDTTPFNGEGEKNIPPRRKISVLFLGGKRNWSFKAFRRVAEKMNVIACVLDGDDIPDYWGKFCESRSIPVYTYKTICEAITEKKIETADIGVCFLHTRIIKSPLLRFPKQGIINFHPAPLPEHKGIAGSSYALLHDYKEWGVTAHYMDEGIDTGDIIKVDYFNISKYMRSAIVLASVIYEKLYSMLKDIVAMLENDGLPESRRQSGAGHYYSHKSLEKDKAIASCMETDEIDKRIEAFWFPPFHGAFVELHGKKYSLANEKILKELGKMYEIILDERRMLNPIYEDDSIE
jgi:methionyl-tRNA formyltransferase